MLLDLVKTDNGLDGQMVESVVSSTIWSQFLCIVTVSSLLLSEKGVTMGRMLIPVYGVRWGNR